MFVELHLIQNFAPSNLNRDDTGAPKDCEFGGYRRARISSQCLKRAVRTAFSDLKLIPEAQLAQRTKRVTDALTAKLVEQEKDETQARAAIETLLEGVGLAVKEDKTQYLLFLGQREIDAIARLCLEHWDTLVIPSPPGAEAAAAGGARVSAKDAKKQGKAAVPKELQNALKGVLDGGKAADLALFGRMIADLPERNVFAASQVAHAISTHTVSTEFDFYTAVDDRQPEDTAGADMLGTIEFNSACFYRYANVDVGQLAQNLLGDHELARQTVTAYLRAMVAAIPTGKQNSMAAHNPPSLIFAVVREYGLWSLANAFVDPVRATRGGDLIGNSVRALDGYWAELTRMYGTEGITGTWAVAADAAALPHVAGNAVANVRELIEQVTTAAFADGGAAA